MTGKVDLEHACSAFTAAFLRAVTAPTHPSNEVEGG